MLAGCHEKLGVFDGSLRQDAVAEIEDVACFAERGHGLASGALNRFGRAKKHGGIDVALDGDTRAELFAKGAHIDAPVHAEDVRTGTRNCGQKVMGSFRVVDDRRRSGQRGNDFLRCGESELLVIAERKFTGPGIEELNGSSAGGDLRLQVGNCRQRNAVQEITKCGGLAEQEIFRGGEAFASTALDHVASKSPGSGGKTEHRDFRADLAGDASNGFGEKGGLVFGIEELQARDVMARTDGRRQVGAGVAEFERQAHGLGGNKDVGEDDDRIDAEESEGLERDFDGEVGRFADFEERVIGANGAVFGQVATGLAHHPDGKTRKSFATASAEKQVFSIERSGIRGHLALWPDEENNKSERRLQNEASDSLVLCGWAIL